MAWHSLRVLRSTPGHAVLVLQWHSKLSRTLLKRVKWHAIWISNHPTNMKHCTVEHSTFGTRNGGDTKPLATRGLGQSSSSSARDRQGPGKMHHGLCGPIGPVSDGFLLKPQAFRVSLASQPALTCLYKPKASLSRPMKENTSLKSKLPWALTSTQTGFLPACLYGEAELYTKMPGWHRTLY